ncbi:MAG: NADPH-dependent FMN reductase [Rhodospirillaceae bacterium]
MVKLVGVSGSLRKESYNSGLLRAAADMMPGDAQLTIGTIDGIPLYNADKEAKEGIPSAVETLKSQVAAADGLIIATPEYNNSMPGVFKNAIDWLSRPSADIPKVFGGKPVAIMGASPGGFGTVLGQNAWLPVLRTLGTRPWFGGRMMVSRAGAAFDKNGALTDETARKQLAQFMDGFVAFARDR